MEALKAETFKELGAVDFSAATVTRMDYSSIGGRGKPGIFLYNALASIWNGAIKTVEIAINLETLGGKQK